MGIVLVTGAAGGFGLPTALEFARQGHTVMAGVRDASAAWPLERAAASEALPMDVVGLDIADERSVHAAIDRVLDEHQRIDVVAHCERAELQGAVRLVTDAEVRWQLEQTVVGMVRLVREVLPTMRRQGSGSFVVLGSIAGLVTPPYWGLYAAAMRGVEAVAEAMHYELGQAGVKVSVVETGQFGVSSGDLLRVAERQTPDTVEHERARRFDKASLRLTAGGQPPDPLAVARAIVTAATGPTRQFRFVVGTDAALVAAARERYDFESFEQVMRKTLDWWD